jgi:hypothetical protein
MILMDYTGCHNYVPLGPGYQQPKMLLCIKIRLQQIMTTAILKIKEKPHISVREMGFSKSAKGYRLLLNSDLRLI